MRYLVVSKDALDGHIRSSEHFPQIVDIRYAHESNHTPEAILRECFTCNGRYVEFSPRDGKQYVIIPIHTDAKLVTFYKRNQYDVKERPFLNDNDSSCR